MKRALALAIVGAFTLGFLNAGAPLSAQSSAPDALTFHKSYFVTGDYVSGGIGLRGQGVNGTATGAIVIRGVPERADILAAFLYWQVVAPEGAGADAGSLTARFKGKPLSSPDGPFAKPLGPGSAACWSSAGGTGAPGATDKNFSYRADVLRLLDVDPATGKFTANGPHTVELPDGAGTTALGASLVIVYRDSTMPLRAIVMYDGGYTMDGTTPSMTQRIRGFYDPATTAARLTFIVGSGREDKWERLLFNGAVITGNPFQGEQGASWDNRTFDLTSPTNLTQVTTAIDRASYTTPDCLTWNAAIYTTLVNDSDGDGLLNAWEVNRASSTPPLVDPTGDPLPYLGDMGADPNRKDVFMEIGYTHMPVEAAYRGVAKPAHTHLPSHEALKLVGDAFKNAPEPIAMHVDVGNSYPVGDPSDPTKNADEYIIRGAGLARGGEAINEQVTVCTRGAADPPWVCQFPDPGTIGWKTGFRYLRDEVISVTPPAGMPTPPPGEDFCDTEGYTCNRRFDRNRMNIFRYALFAHAIGLPKSEEPCLDVNDQPVSVDSTSGQCTAPLKDNPEFHVSRTSTGVGDFPGGDAMVTLGAFDDMSGKPIGSPFMQASTLMHEFGHNAERRHGGEAFAPNCTPTYLSAMNYLYQLRGLLDDSGKPHLDFSRQVIAPPIDESSLVDGSHASLPYRIGWYAPLAGSYLEGFGVPATRHCDGSELVGSAPMVRIDSRTAAGAIDWNANGLPDAASAQDVNFNGRTTTAGAPEILNGSDDWSNLVLNQTGARRNTGGLYVETNGRLAVGALSLDTGRGDLGRGDLGRGDLGRGDLGRGDLGRGDLGRGDLGRGDLGRGDLGNPALGRGDLGRGDLGGGDLFVNDPNNPSGELDFETAIGTAKAPPNEFQACVIGVDCPVAAPLHGVQLDWKAPNVGDVTAFSVYRVAGATLLPGDTWVLLGTVSSQPGKLDYSALDTTPLANGAPYTYFAVATYGDGTQSDPSNLVTITGVNEPPTAVNDSYTTRPGTPLVREAPGVLANDSDPEGLLSAVLVTGPANGTLQLNADGSFTYTPRAGFSGTDSFTYAATDGGSASSATVTIEVRGELFGFVGVQNLPPIKRTFNPGSSIPLRWRFTSNGKVFNSVDALPELTILNSAGVVIYTGTAPDPGSSSFQEPTAANDYTWQFNWQTKGLKAGTYRVYVGSQRSGQVYSAGSAFGPFSVVLK